MLPGTSHCTLLHVWVTSLALLLVGCAKGQPPNYSLCGDGLVEGRETCDDGNTDPGDGCNGKCELEPGYQCDTSEPNICAPICGDGLVVGSETCDGTDLAGRSCGSLNLGGGELLCTAQCELDPTGCTAYSCGNGTLDGAEECDGADLGGHTCLSEGFDRGVVACSPLCTLETSGCSMASCGDGLVEGSETCDDGGIAPGDGCSPECQVEDGWLCTGEPSVCERLCGNGVIDPTEDCEGDNLDGQDCTTLGMSFEGGTLTCGPACRFDTSQCMLPTCGNGIIDPGEQCDGIELGLATCQSLGFVSGMLQCTVSCGYNTTACVAPVCGDGIISPAAGEQCDDNNTQSGDGCNAACQVEPGWVCTGEPSVCVPSCGNGVWNPGEDCDGSDLNGATCQSVGFAGGTLACRTDCSFNTSGCLASVCPNGVKEGSEECDGSDFGGQTCASFGFAAGSLSCDGSCQISTAGCTNSVCGNGVVEAGEQCDDSNTSNGDGCSSTCQWETSCTADRALACGSNHYLSSPPSGNDVSGYNCTTFGSGVDYVYSFVPTNSGNASVSVTCDNWDDDYDVMILRGSCHPKLCIAAGTSSSCDNVSFPVTAGLTYFIVVEAYWSSYGYGLRTALTCP